MVGMMLTVQLAEVTDTGSVIQARQTLIGRHRRNPCLHHVMERDQRVVSGVELAQRAAHDVT